MPQESLPPESALSRRSGVAGAPKDFDWWRKNIPCQAACPAGTDIPGYLDAIAHRRYEEAYTINLRDNVFPGVLGRVCTRPCEPPCRHGWEGLGESVAICFSKRSAADLMARREPIVLPPVFPPSDKRVIVVGAGAAGLAAARELALWGHQVTVLERERHPGGLMMQGIPPFRLPRAVVEIEIDQIRLQGVDLRCGTGVEGAAGLRELFDCAEAVIVACGTHRPFIPDLPGTDLAAVEHGLTFLKAVHLQQRTAIGRRVVVIGGGFTAVDCARTALRLGAQSVQVFYRRSVDEMYVSAHEIDALEQEGIRFTPMAMPVAFRASESGGPVEVRLTSVMLGDADASGRRRPMPMPDGEYGVEADTVLLATGQVPDWGWAGDLADALGKVSPSGQSLVSAYPSLFVTGDAAQGALSLIDAIGHAKICARAVDRFLTGRNRFRDAIWIEDATSNGRNRDMDAIPRQPMPERDIAERSAQAEVETGYAEDVAVQEAQRCYLCHYKYEIDNDLCIYCDRCLKVKPVDDCIIKVRSLTYDEEGRIIGYERSTSAKDYNMLYIDQNECIRCGACAEVCPVECIPLQKVQKITLPLS